MWKRRIGTNRSIMRRGGGGVVGRGVTPSSVDIGEYEGCGYIYRAILLWLQRELTSRFHLDSFAHLDKHGINISLSPR